MNKIYLDSERLVLKSVDSAMVEQFFDFLMRNKDFFKPWSPKYEKDYFSVSFHKVSLEKCERDMNEGRRVKFAIFKKEDNEKIIGTVSLSNIALGSFLSCTIGYRIDEQENNKGYATEAVKRVTEYAFKELGLHRIEANIIPRNKSSIRIAEKSGYVYEGESKKYLQINGVWEDHLHYVILNEEIEKP